ncbi:MAG: hypothetical protein KBH25_04340, partial [Aeromonadaceae bacterium]|nr:hypothetical protein [Aeromonadaceae bacterium]
SLSAQTPEHSLIGQLSLAFFMGVEKSTRTDHSILCASIVDKLVDFTVCPTFLKGGNLLPRCRQSAAFRFTLPIVKAVTPQALGYRVDRSNGSRLDG